MLFRVSGSSCFVNTEVIENHQIKDSIYRLADSGVIGKSDIKKLLSLGFTQELEIVSNSDRGEVSQRWLCQRVSSFPMLVTKEFQMLVSVFRQMLMLNTGSNEKFEEFCKNGYNGDYRLEERVSTADGVRVADGKGIRYTVYGKTVVSLGKDEFWDDWDSSGYGLIKEVVTQQCDTYETMGIEINAIQLACDISVLYDIENLSDSDVLCLVGISRLTNGGSDDSYGNEREIISNSSYELLFELAPCPKGVKQIVNYPRYNLG